MVDLGIILVLAHILGDYVLQTNNLFELKKEKFIGKFLHSLVIAIVTIILIPTMQGLYLSLIMGVTHYIIDFSKIKSIWKSKLGAFLFDQFLHFVVILVLVYLFGETFQLFWFPQYRSLVLKFSCLTIGIVLNLPVSNFIITKFFLTHYPNLDFENGLKNAGKFIGYLERIIIMIMVLTDNITGIGFLVTAKSILRIGKITDNKDKKEAEYIILGTFLSFVLALLWSYLLKYFAFTANAWII